MSEIMKSEENRRAYAERKDRVLMLLKSAEQCYTEIGEEKYRETFSTLYMDLEKGEFSIVIVGEFSSGKSTLLNAMMGRRILPSFSNETTATVNCLRHLDVNCGTEYGKVFYYNGDTKIIRKLSLETIKEYVSTEGENVAQNVREFDLYIDSDFLDDGVTLVDSPGLNGVADGHREITLEQILKSHACIFLFNSDHPGSKTDFDFLEEIQQKVNTAFFVLNKIDEIKTDENETPEMVVESLKNTYKKKFPKADTIPEIWPVSAYQALVARSKEPLEYHGRKNRTEEERKELEEKSRLGAFEDRLLTFLTCGEKARDQLLASARKVLDISEIVRTGYEHEKNVLESAKDTSEIDDQIASIKEAAESIEKEMSERRRNVSYELDEVFRDLREEFSARIERFKEHKLSEIDNIDDGDELISYLRDFDKKFQRRVCSLATEIQEKLEDGIGSVIEKQSLETVEDIQKKIAGTDQKMELQIKTLMDIRENIFEVGLREMDKKKKEMEDRIKELSLEEEESERNYYAAVERNAKIDDLKNEIKKLEETKEMIKSRPLPDVEHYYEEELIEQARGGVLGKVTDILVGKRTVVKQKQVENRERYEEAKTNQEKELEENRNEIKEKERELMRIDPLNSVQAEQKFLRKSAEKNEVQEALKELMKENTEKISKKYAAEIRRIKRELRDHCDEITDELEGQMKIGLRNSKMAYVQLVIGVVEANLKESLEDKHQRLEQLSEQIKSSEKDRNARIEELSQKIGKLNLLMDSADDVCSEIMAIPVDVIRQDKL